jgi:hypothetical protein
MTEKPHAVYLPPTAGAVPAAAGPARRALEYILDVAPTLRQRLGVTVEVYTLRLKDAADPRVTAAFRRRGIGSLPALLAGGHAYVGCREIEEYYSRRIGRASRGFAEHDPKSRFKASGPTWGFGGGDPAASAWGFGSGGGPLGVAAEAEEEFANASAEEELDAYMRHEMGGWGRLGGGIDVSELGYGGGDD